MALPTNAAVVAERFARLRAGHLKWRRGRRAEAEALAAALADAPLAELVKHIRPRVWITTSLYLAGWSLQQIADVLGYTQQSSVAAVLKRPEAVRLVELVRAAQLEQVLHGRFGAVAAAQAAAPELVAHLAELGGAHKDRESGTRRGRARRDADVIRASEVVLDVAGTRVQRHQHQHMHQFAGPRGDDRRRALGPRRARGLAHAVRARRWAPDGRAGAQPV